MTIIKKFDPEEHTKKFPKKYIILTVMSLFVLILIEIWTSNVVVSFGAKFEDISALKKTLQMENQILENEIAKYSSLSNVATHSASLGFSKIESVQYIR